MDIKLGKETMSHFTCAQIALANKPDLLARPLDKPETLVLVVDMINGFAKKGALASPRVEALIPRIADALELLPSADLVFLRDEHTDASPEFAMFPAHCNNAKESKVVAELSAFKHTDIPKNSTNGFFNLKEAVDLSAYNHIMIMGCCTDICIMQLALTLKAYFNERNETMPVTVFTEYVETYDSNLHPADICNLVALKLMEDAGISIFKGLV